MSNEPSSPSNSLHLPLGLLALAFAVFLGSQIGANNTLATITKWQNENITKGIENYKEADKQAAEAIKNRESLVKQSGEFRTQFDGLLTELLELAPTDPEAKKIVDAMGIQRVATPAPAAPAAAPAATPAK